MMAADTWIAKTGFWPADLDTRWKGSINHRADGRRGGDDLLAILLLILDSKQLPRESVIMRKPHSRKWATGYFGFLIDDVSYSRYPI